MLTSILRNLNIIYMLSYKTLCRSNILAATDNLHKMYEKFVIFFVIYEQMNICKKNQILKNLGNRFFGSCSIIKEVIVT